MTIYYVSALGKTGAAGTNSTAPLVYADAKAVKLQPGDTMLFRCGDTFRGVFSVNYDGTADQPIILGAYGEGAKPIIDGTGAEAALLLNNRSHVYVRGLRMQGAIIGVKLWHDKPGYDLEVSGCELTGSDTGLWQSAETGAFLDGVRVNDNMVTPGVTRRGSLTANQWGICLNRYARNFQVNDNLISSAGEDAITLWKAKGGECLGNVCGGNGENSIDCKDSSGVVIGRNTAKDDHEYGIIVHEPSGAGETFDNQIVGNTVLDAGHFLRPDGLRLPCGIACWNSENSKVTGNTVRRSYGGGLHARDASGLVIEGNILEDNGAGQAMAALVLERLPGLVLGANTIQGNNGPAASLDGKPVSVPAPPTSSPTSPPPVEDPRIADLTARLDDATAALAKTQEDLEAAHAALAAAVTQRDTLQKQVDGATAVVTGLNNRIAAKDDLLIQARDSARKVGDGLAALAALAVG